MASEWYDFSRYSVLDIRERLENEGLSVTYIENEKAPNEFIIQGTDVSVEIPAFSLGGDILAQIYWKDYPRIENYEKSKKLYHDLVKRFGVKKGEPYPTTIKDYEKIKEYVKDFRKDAKEKGGFLRFFTQKNGT